MDDDPIPLDFSLRVLILFSRRNPVGDEGQLHTLGPLEHLRDLRSMQQSRTIPISVSLCATGYLSFGSMRREAQVQGHGAAALTSCLIVNCV